MIAATANIAGTRSVEELAVGDRLPDVPIDITPTLVVSTAIATRDFQDVHHDRDLAQQRGSKDIFMNILTSTGLVGRYVTDWLGPNAVLRGVSIRLGAPNHPYDTMTLRGDVTSVDPDGRTVEIAVRGDNGVGTHVSGTVVAWLP